MNKICTDIDQSKKLYNYGINIKTSDMYWLYDSIHEEYKAVSYEQGIWYPLYDYRDIPAWSLNALLILIKCDYKLEKTLLDQSDYFTYSINCPTLNYRTNEYEDPIDACMEMIIWLKENKYEL